MELSRLGTSVDYDDNGRSMKDFYRALKYLEIVDAKTLYRDSKQAPALIYTRKWAYGMGNV